MTENEQFRYHFEHTLLPKTYYSAESDLLNSILDKGGKFFSDVYLVYSPDEDIPYREDDFKIIQQRVMHDEKMLYFVIVDMPEPTDTPLCRRVYFCYAVELGIPMYYTSELTYDGGYMLCAWDKDYHHLNYGRAPKSREEEFHKVGNLFLKHISKKK